MTLQLNPSIITDNGHALMAKLLNNTGTAKFTKIVLSDTVYKDEQLQKMIKVDAIKQTSLVSSVTVKNAASVEARAPFTNTDLKQGYFINTIGLYAQDPTAGEILYSVTTASENAYMPPFNGITSSSIVVELTTIVSNAANVSLEINPAAVVSFLDLEEATTITDASLAAWVKQEAGE